MRLLHSFKPPPRTRQVARPRLRPALERLEDRTLPSAIVWVNEGTGTNDSDAFRVAFGPKDSLARIVVESAIKVWQDDIVNFNYSNGSNTFSLSVFAGPETSAPVTKVDANHKPMAGTITLSKTPTGPKGFDFDSDPNSNRYAGQLLNAYCARAFPGGDADKYTDLFSAMVTQLSRVLGLMPD